MEFRTFALQRGIQTIVTIFVGLTIVFLLFRLLPGDPVEMLARDPRLSPEAVLALKEAFGLDKPLYVQYYLFLVNALQLNFGISFYYKSAVSSILIRRLSNTLLLVGLGTLLSTILGLVIGIIGGWFRGKWPDKIGTIAALLLYSMPSFWIGMVLVYAFAVVFPIFPTGGITDIRLAGVDPFTRLWSDLRHLALPLITYSLIFAGQYAITVRNSLINVLGEDYILTAKAKGLTDMQILRRHAVKNAALPATTLIAMNLGLMVLGTVSVETVFVWPGVGLLVYNSIMWRDFPLLQGAFIIFIVVMIVANYIADLLYAVLDPRVRY